MNNKLDINNNFTYISNETKEVSLNNEEENKTSEKIH